MGFAPFVVVGLVCAFLVVRAGKPTIYDCYDISCICTFMKGSMNAAGACTLVNGQQYKKAIRKEYRQMSDDERKRFNAAMLKLKKNGEYDKLVKIHSNAVASGAAYSGPAFLPWNREFCKREALMGGNDSHGNVISGPFSPWKTLEGHDTIQRSIGEQGKPFDENEIGYVLAQNDIDKIMAYTAPKQGCPFPTDLNALEYTQGNVHIFIGGDMQDTSTSANDPIFFMHHAMVDLIWEMWRQQKQTRTDRETQYPQDNLLCSTPQHFSSSMLIPFAPMRNVDGLSNKYTDNLYEYAPRPRCPGGHSNECGSRFLFCDLSHGLPKCAAKMRKGAACAMFTRGEEVCADGNCRNGKCAETMGLAPRLVVGLICAVLVAWAQDEDPCAKAPNAAAKIMCKQIHKWDGQARNASAKQAKTAHPPGFDKLLGSGGAAPDFATVPRTIYECIEMSCVCTFMRGTMAAGGVCMLSNGQQFRKSIRKEYRQMTDDERQRYNNVMLTLKQNGEYDKLAKVHSDATASGAAHSGPAFLSWHREYCKRVEFAIRQIDPTLYLPYWDSVLDNNLPKAADSALFTPEMMGETDAQGNVISGPFTPWRTLQGRATIQRKVGEQANPFDENAINFVLAQTEPDQVMAFTAPKQGCPYRTDFNCLEYTHGNPHIFIGGDMFDTSTSANDPIFFMHHAMVDLIWEMWRQTKQTRADRETRYPPDNQLCSAAQHFAAGILLPFAPIRNIDGLSNKYTDELYEYAPRPRCPGGNSGECGSRFLFCDLSHGQPRCAAKMKPGAVCNVFTRGEDVCMNGACQGGRCVLTQAPVTPPKPTPVPKPTQPVQSLETCFNENKCCATWASRGECARNQQYMQAWCKASCGVCKPQYPLTDGCDDRHPNCASWSRSGECQRNQLWMSENCRKSCNQCGQTRAAECGAGGNAAATQAPQQACDNSVGCYNENVCCPHWSLLGQCRNNQYMACNCRVSCGACFPQDYNYGSCVDYHQSCAGWARIGECEKNPWMSENCRASCRTCYSQFDLRSMCGTRAGAVSPTATARRQQQQQPPQNWNQQQGWNNNWQAGQWNAGGQRGGNWGNPQWGGQQQWNGGDPWGGDNNDDNGGWNNGGWGKKK